MIQVSERRFEVKRLLKNVKYLQKKNLGGPLTENFGETGQQLVVGGDFSKQFFFSFSKF